VKPSESTRRIRVLHIVGGMGRGGVETWLLHVLRHINRERFQMDFMVHTAEPCPYDDEVRALGSRILPCLRPERPWHYAKNFRRILAAYGPYDIVHSHVHHYSGYTLRLAQHAGVPIRIAHSHNDAPPQDISPSPLRWVYLTIAKHWIRCFATIGLAASGKAAEALFGRQWQRSSFCRLLYYGIDLAPFRSRADPSIRAALQLCPDAFVIVHVGRFDEQKNHGFLLEIFRSVADADSRSRLVLIGDGHLRPAVEQRAAEMGITERVVFAGLRADVPRVLLGVANVFVMPSLHEGLPLAGLEAQAAGLPCVFADSITAELDVVPQLVTRLRLSDSSSDWARVLLAKRDQAPPVKQDEALEVMQASPFDILRSAAELARLYQTIAVSSATRSGHVLRDTTNISIQNVVDKRLHDDFPKTLSSNGRRQGGIRSVQTEA
jgi:glycosyltransferase involved in cell wall biosynthesis